MKKYNDEEITVRERRRDTIKSNLEKIRVNVGAAYWLFIIALEKFSFCKPTGMG